MRKQRNDFTQEQRTSHDPYYNLLDDYGLIEASFAQQYGIRLRIEESMSWGEFTTLLSGLNEKTPLGNIVAVRSEKDHEVIRKFTPEQRKIHSEWKQKNKVKCTKESYDQAMKQFENMFLAMAAK